MRGRASRCEGPREEGGAFVVVSVETRRGEGAERCCLEYGTLAYMQWMGNW